MKCTLRQTSCQAANLNSHFHRLRLGTSESRACGLPYPRRFAKRGTSGAMRGRGSCRRDGRHSYANEFKFETL